MLIMVAVVVGSLGSSLSVSVFSAGQLTKQGLCSSLGVSVFHSGAVASEGSTLQPGMLVTVVVVVGVNRDDGGGFYLRQ